MEDNLTPEQVNELKNQLALTKKELEETRQKQQLVVQTNPQDKFIETLFDKGGQMLIEYSKMSPAPARILSCGFKFFFIFAL